MYVNIQYLCIIAVFILPIFSPAQEWVATYNGPGDSADYAWSLAIDTIGNVYVTGRSYSSTTDYDYATIKYDSSGVEQWVMRYDGPASGSDRATAIVLDNAGNVYVTGRSEGIGTQYDYATVKYNAIGVEQWVARYDGPLSGDDNACAIIIGDMGYVYMTGESWGSGTSLDYATVKYDSSGVEQWIVRYNGPADLGDHATAITIDNVGNTYVTGYSHAGAGTRYDYATVKYDSLGIEQWAARHNGTGNNHDYVYAIALDDADNVYVSGASFGSDTNYDYATLKYNASGAEQWAVRYNSTWNDDDYAYAIALDPDANIIVTGKSDGGITHDDYATVKYDSSGVEQWVARYNGPGDWWDRAEAIAVDHAGNIYVTGYSRGLGTLDDYATIKYNTSGLEQWVIRYDGTGNNDDWATAIAVDGGGDVYITGFAYDPINHLDYTTLKYSPTGAEEHEITDVLLKLWPGPTILSGPLKLPEDKNCRVFDITGRVVAPSKIRQGIYFIEIDGVVTQKVVKVR